jgi:hypothetical protein|tara:strand:- start:593 stop:1282 length:690 start_codon:yes stop_codon:yes gene_type:complete
LGTWIRFIAKDFFLTGMSSIHISRISFSSFKQTSFDELSPQLDAIAEGIVFLGPVKMDCYEGWKEELQESVKGTRKGVVTYVERGTAEQYFTFTTPQAKNRAKEERLPDRRFHQKGTGDTSVCIGTFTYPHIIMPVQSERHHLVAFGHGPNPEISGKLVEGFCDYPSRNVLAVSMQGDLPFLHLQTSPETLEATNRLTSTYEKGGPRTLTLETVGETNERVTTLEWRLQ